MPASPSAALSVYRSLLRAGAAFPDYNIRAYVLRRTRAGFRAQRTLAGDAAAAALVDARGQLALLERQRTIAAMFRAEPSVMEADVRGGRAGIFTR